MKKKKREAAVVNNLTVHVTWESEKNKKENDVRIMDALVGKSNLGVLHAILALVLLENIFYK